MPNTLSASGVPPCLGRGWGVRSPAHCHESVIWSGLVEACRQYLRAQAGILQRAHSGTQVCWWEALRGCGCKLLKVQAPRVMRTKWLQACFSVLTALLTHGPPGPLIVLSCSPLPQHRCPRDLPVLAFLCPLSRCPWGPPTYERLPHYNQRFGFVCSSFSSCFRCKVKLFI